MPRIYYLGLFKTVKSYNLVKNISEIPISYHFRILYFYEYGIIIMYQDKSSMNIQKVVEKEIKLKFLHH